MCIYVPPSPPIMRSEPLVKHLQISIMDNLSLTLLCVCFFVLIMSNIDLNCRFISFNTCLNTLTVSTKAKKTGSLNILILFLSYLIIFEYYFIIFIPLEFWKNQLDLRRISNKTVVVVKMFHIIFASITPFVCYRLTFFGYFSIVCCCQYPLETLSIWIFSMRLVLCPDIHPNPGPIHSNKFAGGFLTFCNWNLNTLSKDNFTRITLLEAHNTEHNYDIISLCETSLDDNVQVPEMHGYKFHSCNHPDGNRSGGVGIFYKESLPLKIREDLSFNESIVCELIFGHRHIFFTVLYRNLKYKANSVIALFNVC